MIGRFGKDVEKKFLKFKRGHTIVMLNVV